MRNSRFKRLKMNIARAILHGLHHDQVHEPHDGRGIGQVGHCSGVFARGNFLDFLRHGAVFTELLEDFRDVIAVVLTVIWSISFRSPQDSQRPAESLFGP